MLGFHIQFDVRNHPYASTMKRKSTSGLTIALLSFMIMIGIITGAWGFTFGRQALKGITQPAVSPVLGGSNQGKRSQGTTFLEEEDILEQVKADISGSKKVPSAEAKAGKPKSNSAPKNSQPKPASGFPIKSQDKDVTFEVRSARKQGDQLILDVTLTNSGSKSVQFLYTFLDITDEQGRILSGTTTGLPAELQPNSEAFSGTITIPNISLENAQKLSLKLQDYPDQDIKLEISDIPVTR